MYQDIICLKLKLLDLFEISENKNLAEEVASVMDFKNFQDPKSVLTKSDLDIFWNAGKQAHTEAQQSGTSRSSCIL